jgi:hypothetical protein
MGLENLKFKPGDFAGQDISSLPDRPGAAGITAAQLKERFDNIGKVLIALGRFNRIIDALLSSDADSPGAGCIGVGEIADAAGLNVQQVLEVLAKARHSHANLEVLESYTQSEGELAAALARAATYVHEQQVPSDTWIVEHALGRYPGVTVIDTCDTVVVGDVVYLGENKLRLSFCAAFAGRAYLN